MSYSRLKLAEIKARLGVDRTANHKLFNDVPSRQVSAHLHQTLADNLDLAQNIATEKARSELLIMPVFVELYKQTQGRISLFSGVEFNIDKAQDLVGVVDFLLARSTSRSVVEAPVVAVTEAKRDDFDKGATQCLGEMVAARIFNQRHNYEMEVFGVITNGTVWQFARFVREDLVEVSGDFTIQDVAKIMGILWFMTGLESV